MKKARLTGGPEGSEHFFALYIGTLLEDIFQKIDDESEQTQQSEDAEDISEKVREKQHLIIEREATSFD